MEYVSCGFGPFSLPSPILHPHGKYGPDSTLKTHQYVQRKVVAIFIITMTDFLCTY